MREIGDFEVQAVIAEAGVEMESQALANGLESAAMEMRRWTEELRSLNTRMEHVESMMRGGAPADDVAREVAELEEMESRICGEVSGRAPEMAGELRDSMARLMQACGMDGGESAGER